MAKINRNMVNRKCKYFKQPEKCVLLQPECNCYQCPIVEWEISKKDLKLFRKRLDELEKENKELKILLADKILDSTRTPQKEEDTNI
jgi:hypothetical protein